ncbi:unnamed protein product [Rhizoctonia solani]|uniref:Tetratricopeptide repeat protein n=1 Tax=Rhizoctonia solani TaxID=456999 RepID=A0A8H3ATA3_9AGAM|nr:unnamed protein product [Rhizoctonia solani]
MSICLSYRMDNGEILYSEIGLSEPYEEVLNAACMAWKNDMPNQDHVIERYLVRDEITDNGTMVVRILPTRFVELVREVPPGQRLELRLELRTRRDRWRSGFDVSSVLELLPAMNSPTHTNNRDASSEELNIVTSTTGTVSHPVQMPMTPDSMFGMDTIHPSLVPAPIPHNDDLGARTVATPSVRGPSHHNNDRNAAYENALSAYRSGRYHDARLYFQAAIDSSRERNNLRQEAECLTHLGVLYCYGKEYPSARSHFSRARVVYESFGGRYREQQLQCDRQLAQIEEKSGSFLIALRAYENIRTMAQNEGFQKQEAWCTYSLGRLHNEIRLYDEALGHLERAVEIAESLPNLNSRLEIEAFIAEESARSEELRGNKSRAIEHYKQAQRKFIAGGRGKWTADEERVKAKLERLQRRNSFGIPVGLGRLFNKR